MISILLYPFLIILLLFFFGIGLSIYLIPVEWRKYYLWLSPWCSIIFLILTLSVLALLGITVKNSSYIIAGVLSILTVYSLFKNKLSLNLREDSIVVFIVILSVLVNLISLLKYEKLLTTVSLGNYDAVNYAFTSDLIKENIMYTKQLVEISSAGDMFHNIFRWGPPLISGFFSALLNLRGYQITYIMQVVLFTLSLPLINIIYKLLFKPSFFGTVFVLIISAFNVNLLYILYHNFYGQVLFWGLELIIIIFYLFYLNANRKKKFNENRYILIIGSALAVLFMSYGEGVIFVVLPIISYTFLKLIFSSDKSGLFFLTKTFLIIFLISSINIVQTTFNIFDRFTYKPKGDEVIGWEPFRSVLPYPNPYEILGFYSVHSFDPLPAFLAVLISTIVVAVIIYGLFKIKNRFFIANFLFLYIFLYYWSGIQRHNYFDYYKVVTYTLFLFLILFTIAVCSLLRKHKIILFIILTILIGFELRSARLLNKKMNQYRVSADSALISLTELNKEYSTEERIYSPSLLVDEVNSWESLWREYFLYPKVISYSAPDSDKLKDRKLSDNSLILIPKTSRFISPKVLLNKIEWENKFYTLGRLCHSDQCLVNSDKQLSTILISKNSYEDTLLTSGWSTNEPDARWSNSKEAFFRLAAGNNTVNMIEIEIRTLKTPQKMEIYLENTKIGETPLTMEQKKYQFNLLPVQNKVLNFKLVFSNIYNPAQLGISLDNRDLSAQLKQANLGYIEY